MSFIRSIRIHIKRRKLKHLREQLTEQRLDNQIRLAKLDIYREEQSTAQLTKTLIRNGIED